jgi:ectoine hydroxylase-related dioxygenase (phytanoyl-CoA dioxygenase family)
VTDVTDVTDVALDIDHPFATVEATAEEVATGTLTEPRLTAVVDSLRVHGAAVVLNAVDLDHCEQLREVMLAELDQAVAEPAALDVHGHVQHNPPPRAEYLYVDVFANPIALAAVRAILGPVVHLSLYTGNTMLGGTAQAQPVHWDDPQLWAGMTEAPPASSLVVNIPLVDVTVENGALEVWPGTHLDVRSGGRLEDLHVPYEWLAPRRAEVPPVRVPIPKGALFIRDARLWHRGTTNSTDQPRPMVAMLYNTWWYRPFTIDFYPDAEPVLKQSGVRVTPRYRESFNHQVWPPNWELVPKPVD